MTIDLRSEAERRYDAERDGSLYDAPPTVSPAAQPEAEQFSKADPVLVLARWLDSMRVARKPDADQRIALAREADQMLAAHFGTTPAQPEVIELDVDGEPTDAQLAKWDAEGRAAVGGLAGRMVEAGRASELFIDTLPGHVNGTPMDILVVGAIAAAIERDRDALGLTRDQMFAILLQVCKVSERYLQSPARRMELLQSGEITADKAFDRE